jgi:hypothetical protein
MDDVELTPLDDFSGIVIAGPQALSIVMALGTANHQAAPCSSAAQAPPPQSINLKQTIYAGAPVSLIQAHSPLVPRFEIWSDPSTIANILAELHGTHAVLASAADLEALRILEGTPKYGIDIRNTETAKDLPQETGQTHALHFAKAATSARRSSSASAPAARSTASSRSSRSPARCPRFPRPLEANSKPPANSPPPPDRRHNLRTRLR